jgi:hypothetical protein
MKATCKHCSETFKIDKSTLDLIESGNLSLSEVDTCPLCQETQESPLDYQVEDENSGL